MITGLPIRQYTPCFGNHAVRVIGLARFTKHPAQLAVTLGIGQVFVIVGLYAEYRLDIRLLPFFSSWGLWVAGQRVLALLL